MMSSEVKSRNLVLCVMSGLFLVASCSILNEKLGLDDDNLVEESFEAVIEECTGIDVDLSPESEEHSSSF